MFFAFSGVVLLFGFVLFFGAPYLPTQKRQTKTALNLLNLKEGEKFYELGCGDGRVLKQAAKLGAECIGYELNPILVIVSKITTWRYRKKVKVVWGDFWRADLSDADAIFVFLLDKYMEKLNKKIIKEVKNPVRLASYAFKINSKQPKKEKNGIYLYSY